MERNPNCTSRRRLWINLKMQNWKLKWRVKWRESDQLNFKSFFNQAFYNSILKMKCYNMMKLFRINQLNHWEINTPRRNTSLVCWQLCIAHILTHPNTNVFLLLTLNYLLHSLNGGWIQTVWKTKELEDMTACRSSDSLFKVCSHQTFYGVLSFKV